MLDAIDFGREVARFGRTDMGYIVDVLRSVYETMNVCDDVNSPGVDSEMKLLFGDFIESLDDCDCIEIVDDESLIDEG